MMRPRLQLGALGDIQSGTVMHIDATVVQGDHPDGFRDQGSGNHVPMAHSNLGHVYQGGYVTGSSVGSDEGATATRATVSSDSDHDLGLLASAHPGISGILLDEFTERSHLEI